MNDKQDTVLSQSVAGDVGMLNHVFKCPNSGGCGTFQKTSVTNLTEKDVECIRSTQNGREVNHPFEDDEFMEILKKGGDKLNSLGKGIK